MKATTCAALLAAIILTLAACARPTSGTAAPGLDLGPAPWQDGSSASYDWRDQGDNLIGTSEYTFSLIDGAWVISGIDEITPLDQRADMRIDETTLAPLGEQKTIKTADTTVELTTTYQDGTLDIEAIVDGETRSASIDVPANALDNDQLLMTLRALPFAEGYEASYVVIVAQNALKIDSTATVQSQEQLDVPAGTFDTWLVELDFGQAKQRAWYQVEAPHTLVQYDNGTNRMVLTRAE